MTEQAVEPDVIETPESEETPGGGETLALTIYEATPGGEIRSNIEGIIKQVQDLLSGLSAWDITNGELYQEAKRTRADIRKLQATIDGERKRLKDLYERPLRAFEDQVKRATGPLKEADKEFKAKLDEYEEREANRRREFLASYYYDLAPDFAELVPFDKFLELKGERGKRGGDFVWLRRSVNEIKARDEMEKALLHIVKEMDALGKNARDDDERVRLKSYYAEHLDVSEALTRLTEDRERQETIRRQEREEAEWRAQQAAMAAQAATQREEAEQPAPMAAYEPPQPEPAPQPQPEAEPVCKWHVVLDAHIEATRSRMVELAQLLKANGLTGGKIEREA